MLGICEGPGQREAERKGTAFDHASFEARWCPDSPTMSNQVSWLQGVCLRGHMGRQEVQREVCAQQTAGLREAGNLTSVHTEQNEGFEYYLAAKGQ